MSRAFCLTCWLLVELWAKEARVGQGMVGRVLTAEALAERM